MITTDEIEAWLEETQESIRTSPMPKERIEHMTKLLALVRCYQEAIQDELKRCGGTVPILKAALKKAKEIIK